MEVNNLLCVGRSRLSQFGKANLSNSSFRTLDTTVLSEMNSDSGLSENELIARMSSRLSSRSASPPTKSILRANIPSPKQGSPSSLRNVRFSDKDSDDDILYAKIHVNKNIQTENAHNGNVGRETKEGKPEGLKLQFNENLTESKLPDVHEIKTSTPRYSQFEETPLLDFQTPRGREEKTQNLQKSPRVNQSQLSHASGHPNVTKVEKLPEHERIIIDIDIDRKKSRDDRTKVFESNLPKSNSQQSRKMTSDVKPDGNRITQNMDLNVSARSHSPVRTKPNAPDGSKIIRNMELNSGDTGTKLKSTASQTSGSEASSPRSASPETPYSNRNVPDGSDIIKNMELSSQNSSLKMKSESVQTTDIPDGSRIIRNLELGPRELSLENKSETVQAIDTPDGKKIIQNMELSSVHINSKNTFDKAQSLNPRDLDKKQFRSTPVQTELESPENDSLNDSFEVSESRSIGVQAPEPVEPKIPDGSQIIRNMEIHKVEKPKSYTESSDDKRSLNDGNWNEFVRHLELFNPSSGSSSSVSVSEDEPSPTPISEPVLVYDRNALSPQSASPAPVVLQNKKPLGSQRLSERSARTFLESEAFTRQQFESVLKEEGLLSKLDTGLKPSRDPQMTAKLAVDRASEMTDKAINIPVVNVIKDRGTPNMFTNHKKIAHFREDTTQGRNEVRQSSFSKSRGFYLDPNAISDKKLQEDKRHQKPDKETLGFTPIETYSFNPETLMKTASNRSYSPTKPSVVEMQSRLSPSASAAMSQLSSSQVTESVSKNAFVQGLDLGPVPKSSSAQRHSSSFSSMTRASGSYKRIHEGTSSDKATTSRYGSSETSKLHGDFTTSAIRSFRSSSLSGLTDKAAYSGYYKSSHSHVTGHSSKHAVPTHRTTQRYGSPQYRPSSAPVSRSKLSSRTSTLTSSLKEMRSSAVRKTAMSHFSDHKNYSAADTDSFWSKPMSPYKAGHNYQKAMQQTSSGAKGFTKSEASYLSRHVRSGSSNYLNALNDKSNTRPRSRERSRSRSPMPSARNAYDKRYSEIKQSTNLRENANRIKGLSTDTNFEVRSIEKFDENCGNFESVVSRGMHNKTEVTRSSKYIAEVNKSESRLFSTQRESRNLTRKPPLPSKMKTPRSSKSSRSRSRSADRKVEEALKQTKEVKATEEHEVSNIKKSKQSHVLKEKDTNSDITDKGARRASESLAHGVGTVTIGGVPNGLNDPDCMYLGHDTIQKIINEAKL